jgi:hypothetical protein
MQIFMSCVHDHPEQPSTCVEMLSILRTDPEVYDDKKQKHLKRFHSKVLTKIELN